MKIGKYELKHILGQGSFGIVYKAFDPKLMIDVALKTMNKNSASNETLKERFYREARAARKLRHPNIVTIYELDEHDGIPFIAMELCDTDLSQLIKDKVEMSLRKKLEIIIKTLKALHYAHIRGLVHRDIKPGNIGIVENDVRILDFGIVKVEGSDMTMAGIRLGTISYMAPEQLDTTKTTNAQTDIFAVGVMLYEFLTYEKPFQGQTPLEVETKIRKEPPEKLEKMREVFPKGLVDAIATSMEKDPSKRFQSAREFNLALNKVVQSLPKKKKVPSTLPPTMREKKEPSAEKTVQLDTKEQLVIPPGKKGVAPPPPPPVERLPSRDERTKTEEIFIGKVARRKPATAAPLPEREIKPLPRKTKKGTSFFYLAGAAIIVISFLSLFFFSKGFQNLKRSLSGAATVEEREGSVVLIASPWAEVREIRNEENEDIPLKGGTVTPSVLKLKPGSYSITLSHPQFGTETVKVRISAGQRVERTIEMFSENPETLLPPLLKEKG